MENQKQWESHKTNNSLTLSGLRHNHDAKIPLSLLPIGVYGYYRGQGRAASPPANGNNHVCSLQVPPKSIKSCCNILSKHCVHNWNGNRTTPSSKEWINFWVGMNFISRGMNIYPQLIGARGSKFFKYTNKELKKRSNTQYIDLNNQPIWLFYD